MLLHIGTLIAVDDDDWVVHVCLNGNGRLLWKRAGCCSFLWEYYAAILLDGQKLSPAYLQR